MAIGKLDFGFNSRSIVDPYSSLMEAMGSRGAMAQALTAADTKQQRDIEEQRARDKMAQEKIWADRNYKLALAAEERNKDAEERNKAAEKRTILELRAKGLNYDFTPTGSREVVNQAAVDRVKALDSQKARLDNLQYSPVEIPVTNAEKIAEPTSTLAKPEPLAPGVYIKKDGKHLASSADKKYYVDENGKRLGWWDQRKYEVKDLFSHIPKYISEEELARIDRIATSPDAPPTIAKETIAKPTPKKLESLTEKIKQALDDEKRLVAGQTTKTVTEYREPKIKDIKAQLVRDYEKQYGEKPDADALGYIGAQSRDIYKDILDRQANAKKLELDQTKAEANAEYMKAMAEASRANSRSSSTSNKAYEEAQKLQREHKSGWDDVRTAAVKANFGASDIRRFNRYANLMEQLNLPPAKGEAVLEAIKNQGKGFLGYFTDVEPTANAINSAVGDLQAMSIDPITGRPTRMPLGDAIVQADKEGYRLTLDPQTGEIMLLK